jgi:hypothetical protein
MRNTHNELSRRAFIKSIAGSAAGLCLGCAPSKEYLTAEITKIQQTSSPPMVYPKLPYQKVQAPENGCLVGFRRVYAKSLPDANRREWNEITRSGTSIDDLASQFNDPKWDNLLHPLVGDHVDYYKVALGRSPAIFVMYETPKLFLDFPSQQAAEVVNRGTIPYLNFLPWWEQNKSLKLDLKDIAGGKHDNKLTRLAKGAAEFGQKHGGFFSTTMEEMNGWWYPWGQNENFIPAWRHIWQIFEDQGANQYATWVWEIYCPEQVDPQALNKPSHPESYYPGDKYVDWIGLSAFSRAQDWGGLKSYQSLVERSYKDMRTNHPDKPIMQAETGKTKMYNQPSWLVDAYRSIKQMPGLKAMIYYDNVTLGINDDKTLSEDSLKVMKEIFRDPYWIMARSV